MDKGNSRCGTIKTPPCSKAVTAEHRTKFGSPSPVMVTHCPHISEKFLSGTYKTVNKTHELISTIDAIIKIF
jgi:hypothetical protein